MIWETRLIRPEKILSDKLTLKQNNMKRLLVAFSAIMMLASCSNSGGESAEKRMTDSLDSIKNLKVESVQEAAEDAIDTIQKNTDSLKERIESVADRTRDSMNQIKK